MCSPSWPKSISKQAFSDYAKERGWSDEQVEKAWLWCTTRQHKINEEKLAAEKARIAAVEAAKKPADPPCICQCPRCKAVS